MKRFLVIYIVIFVSIFCVFKFIPFGYEVNKSTIHSVEVPRFSFLKDECCMFVATFGSFKSYTTLKLELDNMVSKYEKKSFNGETYYYDKERDITITDYGVSFGFPFNEFYISYVEGVYPEE